ncbi:hypothetical protein BDB00DRAFT_808934 [Zychaea mexicana]|uniref:uncharacterized protein n=1 Tax=Zychaea mexicana TaxID=64656 RepID=UPI0022FE7713|nr:uncharacterized protein BDB00DRAFT_808934 [Zychaea mexicana]KAI9496457.1 hypothetical protein BDB00DRAFT_808934 [Zychaea mexicana]
MELPQLNIYTQNDPKQFLASEDLKGQYDGTIVFFSDKKALTTVIPAAQVYADMDEHFGESIQLIVVSDNQGPSKRVVVAPVGSINNDFDDVRRFKDAAFAAGKRALKAGVTAPIVVFADTPKDSSNLGWTFDGEDDFKHYLEVTILGLFESAYEPIDVREHAERSKKPLQVFKQLGFSTRDQVQVESLIQKVSAIEMGRRVSKDIGSPDPERMSPIQVVKYLQDTFGKDPRIKMTVIDDIETIKKEYPLAHAVTRASLAVSRHHPRFVLFEYQSPDQSKVKENLYFVGKGVTYDTGGADIKCSGHMRGMSRDKCGAAAVAGYFKTISMLQPDRVNVRAGLALVRNSVGSDSYVSDEVIYSRNGTRVLVGNTDAEGRMVMTDLLCQFKEEAVASSSSAPNFLFTVATLTGHALRAYNGYGIALDNGFARRHKMSQRIYDAGHVLADPFEISTFRREDVEVVQPGRSSEDVVQANDQPSTMTNRGHQYPAGFMLIASGLDKHGLKDKKPIGFTHLDVAGSAEEMSAVGWSIPRVTGSPVAALTGAFLL